MGPIIDLFLNGNIGFGIFYNGIGIYTNHFLVNMLYTSWQLCQRQGASNLYANLTFLSCRQLNTLKQGVWLLPLKSYLHKRFIVVVLKYPPKVVLIASSQIYRTNPNCWLINFIVIKIYIEDLKFYGVGSSPHFNSM